MYGLTKMSIALKAPDVRADQLSVYPRNSIEGISKAAVFPTLYQVTVNPTNHSMTGAMKASQSLRTLVSRRRRPILVTD
jgi:hypothetical protein